MRFLKLSIKEIETGKEYSTVLNYNIVENYILELFKVTNTDISKIPLLDEDEIFSGEDLNKFLFQLGIYSKSKEISPVIESIYEKFPERDKNTYELKLKFIIWTD